MPRDPFKGGNSQSIRSDARALRSYSNELKRLLGLEKQVGAASAERAAAATAAIGQQNAAIGKTSSLLDQQGVALSNLDKVRKSSHEEEMRRSKSLAARYEEVKQSLAEIREDSDDTGTVLGTLMRGYKDGIDNLLMRGDLPVAQQQLEGVNTSIDRATSSVAGFAGAALQVGNTIKTFVSNTAEAVPTVYSYYESMQKLDTALEGLNTRYNLTDKAAQKLGKTILEASKLDIKYGTEQVEELADQLLYLKTVAGLSGEEGARYAAERYQEVGISLDEAGRQAVQFSQMADMMRDSLKGTRFEGKAFSFALRSDFVAAMMEAHRQFGAQVTDLQNVAAAYQFAAKKAVEFGASSQGASRVAKAFGEVVFGGGITPQTMLAGDEIKSQISEQLSYIREIIGEDAPGYSGMTSEQQRMVQEKLFDRLGGEGDLNEEMYARLDESIRALNDGLGGPAVVEMLGSLPGVMESVLNSNRRLFGNVEDISALTQILGGQFSSFKSLQQFERRRFARMIRDGRASDVVSEIRSIESESRNKVQTTADLQKSALTSVLALKDPVNELFNIKDLLKSLVISVTTIGGLLDRFLDTNFFSGARQFANRLLGNQGNQEIEGIRTQLTDIQQRHSDLLKQRDEASTELRRTESQEERESLQATIATVNTSLSDVEEEASELAKRYAEITSGMRVAPVTEQQREDDRSALATGASVLASELTSRFDRQEQSGAPVIQQAAQQPARQSSSRRAGTPSDPSNLQANGRGAFEVGADGRSYINMRLEVENVDEVVAQAQVNQNIVGNTN